MAQMTSNRPYLVRALYDWIGDNGLTPYLLVDAGQPGVRVPPQAVKDGRVVLNIAQRAVGRLELGDDVVSFQARFGGVSTLVVAPMDAVLAIYAMENGQGMLFPPADAQAAVLADGAGTSAPEPEPEPPKDGKPTRGPHLRVIK